MVDPFIELSIKGIEIDTMSNKTRCTHVIKDNGFNPVWTKRINDANRKKFSFEIRCPELA